MSTEHKRIDDLYNLTRDWQQSMSEYVKDLNKNVSKLNESVALMAQSQEYSQKTLNILSERLADVESEQKKIASEHFAHREALKKLKEVEQIADSANRYIEDQATRNKKKSKIYWRIFDGFLRWSIPLTAGVLAASAVKFWDKVVKVFS